MSYTFAQLFLLFLGVGIVLIFMTPFFIVTSGPVPFQEGLAQNVGLFATCALCGLAAFTLILGRYTYGGCLMVEQNKKIFESLAESWRLTRGTTLKLAIFICASMGIGLALSVALGGLSLCVEGVGVAGISLEVIKALLRGSAVIFESTLLSLAMTHAYKLRLEGKF